MPMDPNINPINGNPILPIGSEAWYVWRERMVVKCQIVGHQDLRTAEHPEGAVYYYIDEPTGHAVDDGYDLFTNFDDAVDVLFEQLEETEGEEMDYLPEANIHDLRVEAVRFIAGTQDGVYNSKDERYNLLGQDPFVYPRKIRSVDWFTVENLRFFAKFDSGDPK